MRKGFVGSLAVLAAGSGLTFGQSFTPPTPSPADPAARPMPIPPTRGGLQVSPGDLTSPRPRGFNPVELPPPGGGAGTPGALPPGAFGSGPPTGGFPGGVNGGPPPGPFPGGPVPGGVPPGDFPGGPGGPPPGMTLPPGGFPPGGFPPGAFPGGPGGPAMGGMPGAMPGGPGMMPGGPGMMPGGPGGPMGFAGPMGPGGPGEFDPTGGAPDMGGPPPGDPDSPRGVLPGLFRGGYASRRFWVGADMLYWTIRDMPIQFPLVTTSSAFGIDFGQAGGATTAPVGGLDRPISFDSVTGYRFVVGGTIDQAGAWGGEVGGFWVNPFSRVFNFQSSGFGLPLLAIPFIDVTTGQPGSYLVSFPGVNIAPGFGNAGGVRVAVESRVWGAEANGVYNVQASAEGPGGFTLLAGPRFLELRERFSMDTNSTTFGVPPVVAGPFFPGGGGLFAGAFFGPGLAPYTVLTSDRVRTVNDFYAAQVGFRGTIGYGAAFAEISGKVAPGYMRSYVDLQGSSTLIANDGTSNAVPGGIFNNAQDLGRHRSDQFAVLLEGGLNVGYYVAPWLRLQFGYTFMWVNNVLRATTAISPYLNPNLIPTSPSFTGVPAGRDLQRNPVNLTDFDVHGFNVGIQLTF